MRNKSRCSIDRGEWITRGSSVLIGGCVRFPGAASGTAYWHTKVLTVLSEFDVTATTTGSNGETGCDHQVDGRVDRYERKFAANFLNISDGSERAWTQSTGTDGSSGGSRLGQFGLSELCRPSWQKKSRENPCHSTSH